MKRLVIAGSTGSVGRSTLAVIDANPYCAEIFALTANTNHEKLLQQCLRYQPKYALMIEPQAAQSLARQLRESHCTTEVLCGYEALDKLVALPEVTTVMAAIVGAAGLSSTYAAACAGKEILLANKEALVMAGSLLMQAAQLNHASLIPVDSEHNAIWQCLPNDYRCGETLTGVSKIILTASGGGLRDVPLKQLAAVTVEQACQHPNWQMGKKITIDSATMMNKALEIIEAYYLFAMPSHKIEALLHPQSIVHGAVQYQDGSLLAQMGQPDMQIPIANALSQDSRLSSSSKILDLIELGQLSFAQIDTERYPALSLAYEVLARNPAYAIIFNAFNEVAIEAFIAGKIGFTSIVELIKEGLQSMTDTHIQSLAGVLAYDQIARQKAESLLTKQKDFLVC